MFTELGSQISCGGGRVGGGGFDSKVGIAQGILLENHAALPGGPWE